MVCRKPKELNLWCNKYFNWHVKNVYRQNYVIFIYHRISLDSITISFFITKNPSHLSNATEHVQDKLLNIKTVHNLTHRSKDYSLWWWTFSFDRTMSQMWWILCIVIYTTVTKHIACKMAKSSSKKISYADTKNEAYGNRQMIWWGELS